MKNIPLYEVSHINNLRELIKSSARQFSEKPAFLVKNKEIDKYEPISFSQYDKDVDSLGTALMDMGLRGKRIAIIGENRYEWAVSYLAVVNGTGIVVPIDKELPENEIQNLFNQAQVSAVIFSGSKREQIINISKRVDFIEHYIDMDAEESHDNFTAFRALMAKGRELLESGNKDFVNAEIDEEAMHILLFTSATTDKPKGVMLSHRNICTNLMAMVSMTIITENDTFLSVLPMHHTYECTCGFLCPLYRGSTVAFCEGLRHIAKNLNESKATMMLGVPLIFEAMYRRIWEQVAKVPGMERKLKLGIKISNFLKLFNIDITKKLFAPLHNNFGGRLRMLVSGAAAIDPNVAKGFRSLGIHFIQGYGLTECSPIVALNRDVDFNDASAGYPLPNVQIRIDNPGADGVGEIVVKGPNVMLGYYENPEMNEKVFKDGWFYTGDLGYVDENGFLFITGRKKNVIVTKNGKNIYPEEIETLLNKVPIIKESIVYGKEDEASGDVVVSAMIVPDMEFLQEINGGIVPPMEEIENMVWEEVKKINKTLVSYKYIKDITLREDEFAKTTTKKIKRYMEVKPKA